MKPGRQLASRGAFRLTGTPVAHSDATLNGGRFVGPLLMFERDRRQRRAADGGKRWPIR